MFAEATLPAPNPASHRAPPLIDPADFAAHRPTLLRYAMARLRNQARAEDAVQETLLAAMGAHQRFAGRCSASTWLTGILKHKIADCIRAAGRVQSLDENDPCNQPDHLIGSGAFAGSGAVSADWFNPELLLARKRFFEILEGALATLPQKTARALLLREVLGLDNIEISRELAVSLNNCFVMQHRARAALRARLIDADCPSAAAAY